MRPGVRQGLLAALAALGILGLSAGLGLLLQAGRAKDTLEGLTQPAAPRRELGVYVLAEDPAQELSQAAGYAFGGLAQPQGAPALLEAALGRSPDWTEYPTAFALAAALKAGECRAILLEEALRQSLPDAQGFAWTQQGLRKLGSVELPWEEGAGASPAPAGEAPQRFVVYLSGCDTFGDVSTLSRSDVNILAAVNLPQKRLSLLATPRDFYLPFPCHGGAFDKLAHGGLYGARASADALEQLYGISVDYTLKMNFSGFVEIIDALGGVSVYSHREFTVENIRTYQKGYNHLTGLEALAFARERMSFPEGDYQRAKNQMEVIRAVAEKAASPALGQNLSAVLDAVAGNFQTDMPYDQLLALAGSLGGSWEVSTQTAFGESAYRETHSMPGASLYVILPDEDSVSQAAGQLKEALEDNPL